MRRFACVGGLVAVAGIAATVRPGGLAFTAPAAAASPQPAITLSVTSGKPGTPVKITGFLGTKAVNPEGAKAFLQYLISPEAQAIFKEDGFGPRS